MELLKYVPANCGHLVLAEHEAQPVHRTLTPQLDPCGGALHRRSAGIPRNAMKMRSLHMGVGFAGFVAASERDFDSPIATQTRNPRVFAPGEVELRAAFSAIGNRGWRLCGEH
jgi:hypothetical protein